MPKSGRIYVFEGVDGAGKSSISMEFARSLQTRGIKARLVAFPGNSPNTLGALVYRIHHEAKGCGVDNLTPASLQTLHIAAHIDAIETTIIPLLEQGVCIVLDRYWWSTWVYGLTGGMQRDMLNSLIEVERHAWGRWLPTCVFYVTRAKPLRPMRKEDWQCLKTAYEELATMENGKYPIHMVQNETTPEVAVDQAFSKIVI